ncbi:MAG: histidine phosphatase family protein [Acidobacteria bacterium]|nr:histidine phosphatase family protein [Acidobacteriota bacterium]
MPRIFLVRSGQTDEQEQGLLVGRRDPSLSDTGHWQAKCLARRFRENGIHHVAVSPQRRSVSTAMRICDAVDLTPELVGGFEGVDLGEWEGKRREWVLGSDAARFEEWRSDVDFPAPGGESLRNIYRRAFPDLVSLVERRDPDESLVVVAPATILRVLCCGILDLPLNSALSFRIDCGGVSSFARLFEGGPFQLIQWNDLSHLKTAVARSYELEQEAP